jgi:integrase
MYKQQILKIPDELVGILNDYIKSFEIDNKLLEFTTKSLGDRVKRIFKDLVNKNVSVNILRHSYISYILANRKLFNHNKLYEISQQMAHSMNMQSQYAKIED